MVNASGYENRAFMDITYLHGLKDLAASKSQGLKVLWLIAVLGSLGMLCFQLQLVAQGFMMDEVGTVQNAFIPDVLPDVMVCPRFNVFRPDLGVSHAVHNFLMGYFLTGVAFDWAWMEQSFPNGIPKAEITEEEMNVGISMLADANYSLETLLLKNTVEPESVILRPFTTPNPGDYKLGKLVIMRGTCFTASALYKMNKNTADYTMILLDLNPNVTSSMGPEREPYHFYVGAAAHALKTDPGLHAHVRLFPDTKTDIKVRVTKIKRYEGRTGGRCHPTFTRSDYKNCGFRKINKYHCSQFPCNQYVPASEQTPEETAPNLCNYYKHAIPCAHTVSQNKIALEKIATECLLPCVEYEYDLQVHEAPAPGYIQVMVLMDGLGFSKQITEYPLVTVADFLSGVGGTVGLWFGASVLSIVQIFLHCGHGAWVNVGQKKRVAKKPKLPETLNA